MSERRGFTLVELLLALAILATLLAVAYGGVIQFMQSRSDLEAAINAQAKLRGSWRCSPRTCVAPSSGG